MFNKVLCGCLVCFLLILSACDSGQTVKHNDLTSTDLSSVNVDNIVVGQAISDINLTKYTAVNDSFEKKEGTYYFEELHIETNTDGIIQSIQGNLGNDNTIPFSINGTDNLQSINEVAELLGQNYNDYWFDREQGIRAYTYFDSESSIYATFAYHNNSRELVWVILTK